MQIRDSRLESRILHMQNEEYYKTSRMLVILEKDGSLNLDEVIMKGHHDGK